MYRSALWYALDNYTVADIKEQKTNLYTIDESAVNQKISGITDANLGRR